MFDLMYLRRKGLQLQPLSCYKYHNYLRIFRVLPPQQNLLQSPYFRGFRIYPKYLRGRKWDGEVYDKNALKARRYWV